MGSGASSDKDKDSALANLPKKIDKALAKDVAGDKWDDILWEQLEKDAFGFVLTELFLEKGIAKPPPPKVKDPRRQFNDKEKNEVKLAFDSNRQKDPMYHKGKITAKNGDGRALLGDGTYDITYLDGDRDMGVLSGFIRVPPDNREIEPPKYFKGTIKKRNDDGDNFDVAYDNGTSERGVLAAFIRLEETDEGETPTSGGGGPRSPKSPMGPKSPKAVAAEFLQGTRVEVKQNIVGTPVEVKKNIVIGAGEVRHYLKQFLAQQQGSDDPEVRKGRRLDYICERAIL